MRSFLLALLLASAAASGCATTKPWQREHLAQPEMAVDQDADREALRHHMLGTREGAVGALGGGGGGCGCN
jgi:hypothetical protein